MALQMVTCHKIRGGAITKRNKHCICIKEHEVTFEVSLSYKKKFLASILVKVKGDVIFVLMKRFAIWLQHREYFIFYKKKQTSIYIN